MSAVAVLDIGKTNLKLALVDPARGEEIGVETAPNRVLPGPPWPHFDTRAQWEFLTAALARAAARATIAGIVVVTHGACAALLDADGNLAAPVLDYEHDGPAALRPAYERLRPPFAQTGSPALPGGLNLGAQLHYMLAADPGLAGRLAQVLTWPQYWGFRLTGARACDLCSLGCHTDLWDPGRGTWSDLPARLGLAGRMAPPRRPGEVLGTLVPDLQRGLGIGPVPVLVGIHDSNASLLPHLAARTAPFAVVSTGTWVVAMAVGGRAPRLDPGRDTLVNVDARGRPVPSARFMGGREHDLIRAGATDPGSPADAARVLARGLMLRPAVVAGTGPFPDRPGGWCGAPGTDGEAAVALGYYLGLMTAECLAMIGAEGPSLIEGPFAANRWFLEMLASASGRPAIASAARTGTALGAAGLFAPGPLAPARDPVLPQAALADYAQAWRRAL